MDKMKEYLELANMLTEALPYIQRLYGKTVVIKYGGAAMTDKRLSSKVLEDIVLLKTVGMNPIVVHGGGPDINKMLGSLDIKSEFYNGMRITNDDTMDVVQMVLTGKINKQIVSEINRLGANAIGLCGIDAGLIKAIRKPPVEGVNLGNVGDVISINTELLNKITADKYIPVIAPIGVGIHGESFNINADTAASEIATSLKAEKLMFLTDIDGIYKNPDDPSSLIYSITINEIYTLIEHQVIKGGMLPKVKGCVRAIQNGVNRTHILNGTIPHPLLLEIFTDSGIGTMVTE